MHINDIALNHTGHCPAFSDANQLRILPDCTPFYYSNRPSLLAGISDQTLALAAPIISFWALSLAFHLLDTSQWQWLEQYRIHESSEVRSRNRASRVQVVLAVILQQIIQSALGFFWMSPDASSTKINHQHKMQSIASKLASAAMWVFDEHTGKYLMHSHGPSLVYVVYWWGLPLVQFLFAMCVFMPSLKYALAHL